MLPKVLEVQKIRPAAPENQIIRPIGFSRDEARMLAWVMCGRGRIALHMRAVMEDLPRASYVGKTASGIAE